MSQPSTRAAGIRLLIFAVIALAITVTVAATIQPFGSGTPERGYTAIFDSASRLKPGDDVLVAGVAAGKVRSVAVTPDAFAEVHFDLATDVPITTSSRLEIRYLDLAGDRYLAVVPGIGSGERQPPAQTISTGRTQPALDLDNLLDGFKPLLVALNPADVNSLTLDIIRTLQGDGDTVRGLIARTASLTTGLAQRDQLIGEVVDNLDVAVGTVADRHTRLEDLIAQLRSLVGGLARDRNVVGEAIGHIDTMTSLSAALLARARPSTQADIDALAHVAATLASPTGRAEIDHALTQLPDKLARLTATAAYGSWFNYYVCGLRITLGAGFPALDAYIDHLIEQAHVVDTSPRCAP